MTGFQGFPGEALSFFRGLEKNNSREWFNEHKRDYEEFVKTPVIKTLRDIGRFSFDIPCRCSIN